MTTKFSVSDAGVADIAAAVRRGEVTPAEVLESVFERIDAVESRVQAWSQIDRDVARSEAAALSEEAARGDFRGPLHGVPVGIKEEFYIAGMPTLFRGPGAWIEPEDASVVRKLREAGAIIAGKTHMPIGGVNPPTRNPWNLEHTAGGTSSGSGAAVAARMVPMAVGEQTVGSNLRPAAYCGVAAIKPTYGRIARFGCYPFAWSRDTVGLIGLTVADLALTLNAVSGYDPKDPTSLHDEPPPADLAMTSYGAPRIGVIRNFFPERTEAVMLDAIEKSAARLAAAGATVVDAMLPDDYDLAWKSGAMTAPEGIAFNSLRNAGQPVTAANAAARAGELLPATYYVQGRRIRAWLGARLTAGMKQSGLDALLLAVAPGPAPRGLESTGDPTLLTPWSYLGFPTMTVNAGLSPKGLPLGLQFVGTPKDDWDLLRAGAWCENVLGVLPAPEIA